MVDFNTVCLSFDVAFLKEKLSQGRRYDYTPGECATVTLHDGTMLKSLKYINSIHCLSLISRLYTSNIDCVHGISVLHRIGCGVGSCKAIY